MLKKVIKRIKRKFEDRRIEKQMFRDIYKKALQDEKVKQLREKAKRDAREEVFGKELNKTRKKINRNN